MRRTSFVSLVSGGFAIILGMFGNSPATANAASTDYQAPRRLSETFAACMANAGSQTIPSADCLMDERDRQDARLNKVYKELIGKLQGDRRDRMVEAQRAWVQMHEKDGVFEASIFDELGPVGNLDGLEFKALAISERADLLEKYLELIKF